MLSAAATFSPMYVSLNKPSVIIASNACRELRAIRPSYTQLECLTKPLSSPQVNFLINLLAAREMEPSDLHELSWNAFSGLFPSNQQRRWSMHAEAWLSWNATFLPKSLNYSSKWDWEVCRWLLEAQWDWSRFNSPPPPPTYACIDDEMPHGGYWKIISKGHPNPPQKWAKTFS